MGSTEGVASGLTESQKTSKTKAGWLVPAAVLLAAGLLLALVLVRWDRWRSSGVQTTNDAYIHANIVPLSTRVTGTLRTLNVNDYQRVRAGEVIAQVDDADTRAQLEQAESALAAAEAALDDNQVQKRVQTDRIEQARHQVDVAAEDQRVALGQVTGAGAETRRTGDERQRQENLYQDQATTRQSLERAIAQDGQSHGSLESATANVKKAGDGVLAERAVLAQSQQDLRLLVAKDQDLRADVRQRLAAVKAAQVQLDYTAIHAPVDGLVTERKVFPGQLVSPGMEVIAVVEGGLWVQANFEETQLAGLHPGDAADIKVDAVPGKVFHGHVLEFSPTSGSQTSLLPPDNASGNFTKVIQRIPVKISLEDSNDELGRLRPGFSCEVKIHPSEAR